MNSIDDWAHMLDRFLIERGWISRVCTSCERAFYAKARNETRTCQRGGCVFTPLGFLSFSRRRIPLSAFSVAQHLEKAFVGCGYRKREAVCVTETLGKTDLIGAGVQILEPILFGDRLPTLGAEFVLQPVVRMQHFGSSENVEGSSTAFVNACSEEVSAPFERHLEHIDTWLGALSKLGIFMGDVTLLRRVSDSDWGNGLFQQLELFVMYGGLELGDASYGLIPTRENGTVSVIDVGFGLERIVWALNKTASYFDLLQPLTHGLSLSRHAHDTLRTGALLTLCGVEASNEGVGFQLRKICRSLAGEGIVGKEVQEVLRHYLGFWGDFLSKKRGIVEAERAFSVEVDRLWQAKIGDMLKVPRAKSETTEAYAARLVYTLGVPLEKIRGVLIQKS